VTKASRFFLDANILFSAAYSPEGRSAALFGLARKRHCRLITSQFAIEEARRNLTEKRPDSIQTLSDLLNWVHVVREADAKKTAQAQATGLDRDDVPILAAAVGCTEYLVTGDRMHFGRWMGKDLLGVRILSLADAVALVIVEE